MSQRKVPQDLVIARQIAEAADKLRWCLSEQYEADGNMVLRGGNEVVSFYCRPDAEQAATLSRDLERVVGPIRRENALKTVGMIRALAEALDANLRDQTETLK